MIIYKSGFIVVNQVEQPNNSTKNQIFITKEGLLDLLKTKEFRNEADLTEFEEIIKETTKPLNPTTKPTTKPLNQRGKEKDTKGNSDGVLNHSTDYIKLLNQNITDLKEENKRLNEKLEKQEIHFEEKLEKQKQEFNEQYNRQQEAYKNTIDKLLNNVNIIMQRLPEPPLAEEQQTNGNIITNVEAETPKEKKSFFSRLFKK